MPCCGYKGHLIKEFFANYFLQTSGVAFDMTENRMEVHESVVEPWRVILVDTGETSGTDGRLRGVAKYLDPGAPFCMTYGDADVDITTCIKFHKAHGKFVTLTSVQPVARFGVLGLKKTQIYSLQESLPTRAAGSTVASSCFPQSHRRCRHQRQSDVRSRVSPSSRWSRGARFTPSSIIAFWQAMDTLRDKQRLEDLWSTGKAPWKT